MKLPINYLIAVVTSCLSCTGNGTDSPFISNTQTDHVTLSARLNEPIKPLSTIEVEKDKAKLGNSLFHDPALSVNGKISCASCHHISKGGADTSRYSLGINNQKAFVNTPTVINSIHNFHQFWDGRAKNLREQAESAILNPREMGSNWSTIINNLARNPRYIQEFKSAFETGITKENILEAIVEYEKALSLPARFDAYLLGDTNAITIRELEGYKIFKSKGCISCHQGINVGGNLFQKLGLAENYFRDRGNITPADYGRFNITHKERDKYFFKVPSLRNVALTAPYFHDGSQQTLKGAISTMAKYQLGVSVTDEEINLIAAFLHTLTSKDLKKYN